MYKFVAYSLIVFVAAPSALAMVPVDGEPTPSIKPGEVRIQNLKVDDSGEVPKGEIKDDVQKKVDIKKGEALNKKEGVKDKLKRAVTNVQEKRDSAVEKIEHDREELRVKIDQKKDTRRVEIRQKTDDQRIEFKQESRDKKVELKEKAVERKAEFRQKIRVDGEDKAELFEQRKEELRTSMVERRKQSRDVIEERKDEARVKRLEKKDELRAELKEKVSDEKKREAVERFDNQIGTLNERMVDRFTKAVDTIEEFLARVESRADKAAANGLDTTAVDTVFNDARNSIAEARSAIEAQAGVVYEIAFDSEETLRGDANKVKQDLRSDLESVKASVNSAKTSVKNALLALQSVPQVDEVEVESSDEDSDDN